jgi:hypothetical protein
MVVARAARQTQGKRMSAADAALGQGGGGGGQRKKPAYDQEKMNKRLQTLWFWPLYLSSKAGM